MTNSNEPPGDGFGLGGDAFWDAPRATERAVGRSLYEQKLDGVVIDAPRFVPLDRRATLPILACRGGNLKQLAERDYDRHAHVVAVDLTTNVVYLGAAIAEFAEDEPPRPAAPLDPDEMDEGIYRATMIIFDLRGRVGLNWQPTTLWVRVIMRELVSNQVRVELGHSKSSFRDDAVEAFVAAARDRSEWRDISPAPRSTLPSYARLEHSPDVPAQPGVALSVPRVQVLQPGVSCVVHGSFRLPVLARERVRADAEGRRPVYPGPQGEPDGEQPTAVLSISLVIVGADEPMATQVDLRVPTYDPVDAETVTGHFALDLIPRTWMSERAQTYLIYVVAGELFEGPIPTALVAPDRLR